MTCALVIIHLLRVVQLEGFAYSVLGGLVGMRIKVQPASSPLLACAG